MNTNFEWVDVEDCPINIVPKNFNVDEWTVEEEFDLECSTEGPSIVLGYGNGLVITGERPDQLVEFARTLLRMVEDQS